MRRPGLLRSSTSTRLARSRNTSRVMRVNCTGPVSFVRSVYGTGRGWLPQPARSSASAKLIDVHRRAVRVRPVELGGDPHRDTDAAVTGRVRRDGRVAVDRIATGEVHRVVEGPERAGVESDHF